MTTTLSPGPTRTPVDPRLGVAALRAQQSQIPPSQWLGLQSPPRTPGLRKKILFMKMYSKIIIKCNAKASFLLECKGYYSFRDFKDR